MPLRLFISLLLLIALLGCAGSGSTGTLEDLEAVPHPDLQSLEEEIQQQLRLARSDVDARLADRSGDEALGLAFGELGRRYDAYKLRDAAAACYRNARTLMPEDPRWPYYLGHIYVSESDLTRAIDSFSRALHLQPGDLPTMIHLARAHADNRDYDRAEPLFLRVLEIDERTAAARVGLGRVASGRRDFAAAASHFEAALELQPGANKLHYPLAIAYRELGSLERSRELLATQGKNAVQLNDPLMAQVQELIVGSRLHVKLGNRAMRAGREDLATEEFRKAVAADPDNTSARINLGVLLAKRGDNAGALEQLEAAVRLDPGLADAQHNMGTLKVRLGRNDEAIEHYRQALRIDTRHRNAHVGLGHALLRSGELEQAHAAYGEALAIDPRHGKARLHLAAVLSRLGRHAEARTILEEGHGLLPKSAELAHALARLLVTAPDPSVRDGRRGFELANAVFGSSSSLEHARTLAMALAENGEFDRAVELQRQAIRAASGSIPPAFANVLAEDLSTFESGKPCRTPWREINPIYSPAPS